MTEMNDWKYSVIGNITKQHTDDNGIMRYGTAAFKGGAKVYLCGKYWNDTSETISVIGLTRGHKYQVIDTLPELIENVRCKKAFTPAVLRIMDNWEFSDWWWGNTAEDKESAEAFAMNWNSTRKD